MSKVTIYHNPRCSKSRQTLTLLQDKGIEPDIILYLETPPTAGTLKTLVKQLGITPRQLLRTSEAEFKEMNLSDPSLTDDAIILAMTKTPKLIERPIVVKDNKAVLGRPPENVLVLI
ncbi:MAG: arsenate reductase (glutaredoxin) [Pseudomonadales bacterium]